MTQLSLFMFTLVLPDVPVSDTLSLSSTITFSATIPQNSHVSFLFISLLFSFTGTAGSLYYAENCYKLISPQPIISHFNAGHTTTNIPRKKEATGRRPKGGGEREQVCPSKCFFFAFLYLYIGLSW